MTLHWHLHAEIFGMKFNNETFTCIFRLKLWSQDKQEPSSETVIISLNWFIVPITKSRMIVIVCYTPSCNLFLTAFHIKDNNSTVWNNYCMLRFLQSYILFLCSSKSFDNRALLYFNCTLPRLEDIQERLLHTTGTLCLHRWQHAWWCSHT